jgi:hypothetical protein
MIALSQLSEHSGSTFSSLEYQIENTEHQATNTHHNTYNGVLLDPSLMINPAASSIEPHRYSSSHMDSSNQLPFAPLPRYFKLSPYKKKLQKYHFIPSHHTTLSITTKSNSFLKFFAPHEPYLQIQTLHRPQHQS